MPRIWKVWVSVTTSQHRTTWSGPHEIARQPPGENRITDGGSLAGPGQ